ncbi:MAG: Uma2 family endonuclease [Armatimonadetes bacterium]|nr:Uma2 family endonuclease [Armatimonadota bacterium]CUU34872.1 Endonuclease, Uma2 family (restriction endonuclease fold) [Armatimonadetes bacterium DC]
MPGKTLPKTARTVKQSRPPQAAAAETPLCDPDLDEMLERLRNIELIEEDGEPLESDWHVKQIHLLDEIVRQHLGEPDNYFCGGNMFIYYSLEQADAVRENRAAFKGPDFFVVRGVDGRKPRVCWVAWHEGGRYPDLVFELVSRKTARKDKEENLQFYAQVLRVPEYFWYDPLQDELRGFRLNAARAAYEPIEPNERGWLWSAILEAYWGTWDGEYNGRRYRWVRLYRADGSLVPTKEELVTLERQRAEQAEAELQRLKKLLQEKGIES